MSSTGIFWGAPQSQKAIRDAHILNLTGSWPSPQRPITSQSQTALSLAGREKMGLDDYRLIMASSAIPVVCHPVDLDGTPYFDGGLTDAIPVRRALEQGCEKLVVILSKNRGYVRKPQGMRPLYRRACRRYPNIVDAIAQRHIRYNENLQDVLALEQAGDVFLFAPSEPLQVGTYSIREDAERELYDLGLRDFAARKEALLEFLASR